jgi:TetR/AcrR family transcriptional regulator
MPDPIRSRDKEATRARILEAAMGTFAEKGLAASSISEIAAAAGVTKSLIHHHFGSKQALWDAAKDRYFRSYFEVQMGMLEAEGSAELLEESIEKYFDFLKKNPSFVRMIGWMQLEQVDSSFPLGEALTREAVRKLRDTQAAGQLRDDLHPFSILISFLGLAEHWFQGKEMHTKGLDPEDRVVDDDAYLRDLLRIFLEGVRPSAG